MQYTEQYTAKKRDVSALLGNLSMVNGFVLLEYFVNEMVTSKVWPLLLIPVILVILVSLVNLVNGSSLGSEHRFCTVFSSTV